MTVTMLLGNTIAAAERQAQRPAAVRVAARA
jgi:5,10-methylene-tetrahydrofolate dehydrogenase/methenyl tetrahydrofolate cyclohydrolase